MNLQVSISKDSRMLSSFLVGPAVFILLGFVGAPAWGLEPGFAGGAEASGKKADAKEKEKDAPGSKGKAEKKKDEKSSEKATKEGEGEEGAEGSGEEEENEGSGEAPAGKKLSEEERYVRGNLQKFLCANSAEFQADGRVKLVFELNLKNEDQGKGFRPPPSTDVNQPFRWSVAWEDDYFRGYVTDRDGTNRQFSKGLRIGNQGKTILNCWFTDDLEAEIVYIQGTGHNVRQAMALVFTSASGSSIGSNFGSQCVTFQGGAMKGGKGGVDPFTAWSPMRLKLVVRGGTFEAHREGKMKQKLEYNSKTYSSGRLGFIWSGGLAGFINRLEVTGKIDSKKMAEEIRKASGEKKR